MVAYKDLDPLYNANQLLAQANSFFGQTWNPDREIDFNKMVDTQNQYDARQRQSDAQEYAADELGNAKTPEDVARIESEFARIMGDPSKFEKVQEEQRQREQEKSLAELYNQGKSVDDLRQELQRMRFSVGDVEGGMKLEGKNELRYFNPRSGLSVMDPRTGEVRVLSAPERRSESGGGASKPKLGRYMDPDTGEIFTPDFNNKDELANLDPLAINLSKSENPIVRMQIKKALEAKAARQNERESRSQPPAPQNNSSVDAVEKLKQMYDQMMPKKKLVRRRVE